MAKVLVTGGAGFIGSHLAEALLARGDRVVILDNFSDYYDPVFKRANVKTLETYPDFTLIEGDVRDRELVMRIFEQHHPQRVAHLAAMAGVRYSIERASLYVDVNVQGTINLLDAARAHEVDNFVFASTSSIYGASDQIPFHEDQTTDNPLAPYPATKKACEVMGHAYHNMFGLNFTALRFFTVYGPRVRTDMMAFTVLDRIVHDQEITIFNPPEMQRDWTFIEDVVPGIVAALDNPLGYQIINIGRGQPVKLREFLEIAQELVSKSATLKEVPAPASEPATTYASIDRASLLLGYQPRVSIREGLAETWAWYQALDFPNQ